MHCSTNMGERTVFHSEETKAVLDMLYVCVHDEERLVSPQGGVGKVWCTEGGRGGPHPKGEPEYARAPALLLLCCALPCPAVKAWSPSEMKSVW